VLDRRLTTRRRETRRFNDSKNCEKALVNGMNLFAFREIVSTDSTNPAPEDVFGLVLFTLVVSVRA
jgi:hypothetical protein